jgi:hypothetical protein
MIPRRGQGVAGEVSGSFGQIVEGMFEVVDFLPLAPCPLPVASSPIPLIGLQAGDEEGIGPARHVFRRDPASPPDAPIEVRSAVAIDQPHWYYAPRRAPLGRVQTGVRRHGLPMRPLCSTQAERGAGQSASGGTAPRPTASHHSIIAAAGSGHFGARWRVPRGRPSSGVPPAIASPSRRQGLRGGYGLLRFGGPVGHRTRRFGPSGRAVGSSTWLVAVCGAGRACMGRPDGPISVHFRPMPHIVRGPVPGRSGLVLHATRTSSIPHA